MYRISRVLLIAAIGFIAYAILHFTGWFIILILFLFARKRHKLTAFGTARWADISDLPFVRGLSIGQLNVKKSFRMLFNWRVDAKAACLSFFGRKTLVKVPVVHTAVFAPTGVGKGVSFVIPHLMTCRPDSAVVVDFKGENARITAEVRKKNFRQNIVLLDPFRQVTPNPDCFNPLDFIKADSPVALDECRDLANALVIRTGQEKEPHWNDASEMFISGIIAFVVQHAPPQDRSLQTVRGMLSDPDELTAAIEVMRASTAWDGMLARLGNQLTHFRDKELASTLTTVGRHLRFLDSLAIAESTKSSSFDPAALLNGDMTVYCILPPEHMRAQSSLLRMWIGSLLRAVVRGGLQEDNLVHFLIDEAASVGRMDALDDAVDKYRAYGARLQLFYQSMGQLKQAWPEGGEQTLLSNTTQVFFGVNDYPTAEYVSNRLGEETIVVDSWGRSRGSSDQRGSSFGSSFSRNSNENYSQQARKLLKPEEVLSLDPRVAITFAPGLPPIMTRLIRYYERRRQWGWLSIFAASLYCFIGCGLLAWAVGNTRPEIRAKPDWINDPRPQRIEQRDEDTEE